MSDHDPSAARLPALPEFEPAANLWSRIERRHARRRLYRTRVAAGGIASVFVAAVAVFAFHAPTRANDVLAQQRQETMQLEQDWEALGKITADGGYARLRSFDVALQQAYDRRVEGDELDRLWSERNQVLRDLIRTRRNGAAATHESDSLISI
ncbi:MAG: hypothetical protein ABIP56_07130 [Dokdonella sp.]